MTLKRFLARVGVFLSIAAFLALGAGIGSAAADPPPPHSPPPYGIYPRPGSYQDGGAGYMVGCLIGQQAINPDLCGGGYYPGSVTQSPKR